MSVAIKFENISKQYRLGLVSTQTLSHDLKRWWTTSIRGKEDPYLKIGEVNDRATKGTSEYVWALKDIDFEVQQGDVLGIIGKNGAGKSTLLKILSKVTAPTTGSIMAKGRIASLLEVGTGFHPEMTGRENIYMNGSIMGMTKAEITRKLDEIIDFAGVERYIDTPAKRYSSGMTVRLGFAIAAHLEPEILVVDEVLAVGDAEFQKKAIGKMQDVSRGDGRTVLFVSHNLVSVSDLCKTGIILKNGSVAYAGNVEDCITRYVADEEGVSDESIYVSENKTSNIFFKKITIVNGENEHCTHFLFKDKIGIEFIMNCNDLPKKATLSFTVLDSRLRPIFTTHYLLTNQFIITAFIPSEFLLPGQYHVKPVIHIPHVLLLDVCDKMLLINIEDTGTEYTSYAKADLGVLNVSIDWKRY